MASNRNALKKYAPQARLDFIQAVTNRAAQFGISKSGNEANDIQGDLLILNGKAFPRSVAAQRSRLIARIAREGFGQVMEAIAYTWFNRFLAIRYMEVHHYLDHGCRVLSGVGGQAEPEILEKATTVELPGLDRGEIINLKLDGTKDEQIYRKLLIAQCNALHQAMPFLFERIDDETELLLPENLLQSDSIVRKLVNGIHEAEWQEIEIIGWLYQFYISEKKDQVIGKVVKSEDIPAATQLFTPNWIAKYMVQNSLGAQWLATYPDSAIKGDMDYYVTPAEQTPEVKASIDAITPDHLDPEAITLIDPAVGSGHILVEAYDLFRAIYLERGYTKREAARAILTKNLFGLDIDDRAAQMAGFALLMKACADDRSVLRNPPHLNVLTLQDSGGLDADALTKALLPQGRFELVPSSELFPDSVAQPTLAAQLSTSGEAKAIAALVKLFNGAKTLGSLITVPEAVMQSLPLLDEVLRSPLTGDLLRRQAQEDAQEALKPLVEQARLLGGRYNCVVANPPYMGSGGMCPSLKKFVQAFYSDSKSDTFAAFMERCLEFTVHHGITSMVTMQSWMFLGAYQRLRSRILGSHILANMAHLGSRAFDSIGGEVVSTTTFAVRNSVCGDYNGKFIRLTGGRSEQEKSSMVRKLANEPCGMLSFECSSNIFSKIPGNIIGYWASEPILRHFEGMEKVGNRLISREGLTTGDNGRFLRRWSELNIQSTSIRATGGGDKADRDSRWVKYLKGGEYRKWSGNTEFVLDWGQDGSGIISHTDPDTGRVRSHNYNGSWAFREGLTWSSVSTGKFAVRYVPGGYMFDTTGTMAFAANGASILYIVGLLNSCVSPAFMEILAPTLRFQPGHALDVPFVELGEYVSTDATVREIIRISDRDWDSYEASWNFNRSPLLNDGARQKTLAESFANARAHWLSEVAKMGALEAQNNSHFMTAYALCNELAAEIHASEITLICNPHYRYSNDLTETEREDRLKSDTMRELVSYAVGCTMGRYSLAEPGLIYAYSGGEGFDPSRYGAFSADDDGIVPLTEDQWFADDAAARIEEFLGVAWQGVPVIETLATLMDGLTMGKGGEPRSALRAYLSKQFFKDHLQTYKNRPIYWLFSSGKQKAFEALVYLHRYNEGTLARMRTNYVTPLMGKLQQRISDLDAEIAASSSTAEKTRKGRDKGKLSKQLVELGAFDEELRHLADQRIPLDLNDGVKVNYGRFGNLLAFKDKVCGKDKGGDE